MEDIRIWLPVLLYNGAMLVLVGAALFVMSQAARKWSPARAAVTLGLALFLCGCAGALLAPTTHFTKMQLLAWLIFCHGPIYLAMGAWILRLRSRRLAIVGSTLSAAILLVALDAFVVEPRWLEVTKLRIDAPGLAEPVRIALIADIQTDHPGAYEERMMARVAKAKPDLVLYAGDYLHIISDERYREAARALNAIIRHADLHPRHGAFAVDGNVDHPSYWREIFENTGVRTIDEMTNFDLGPVALTAIGLGESYYPGTRIAHTDKCHIVLGHVPDYALGRCDAELMVAGHVHGGQVRLPFIGPILTLCATPRDRAVGHTELPAGRHLVVSRGIGMERAGAPRLRFLCRPELVIIDLVPKAQPRT